MLITLTEFTDPLEGGGVVGGTCGLVMAPPLPPPQPNRNAAVRTIEELRMLIVVCLGMFWVGETVFTNAASPTMLDFGV
ncbi:MAG: hypothetical protein ACR2M1_06265, partial [Gemmatimonadaceae bacterium]